MDGATIDQIVEEAGVAKGSFYKHFPDREALRRHAHDAVRAELFKIINVVNAGIEDPSAYFVRGLLAVFRFGLENRLTARVLLHMPADVVNPARLDNAPIVDMFRKGVNQGLFKLPNPDTGLVLLMGLTDSGLARLLELQNEYQQLREVMHGICMSLLRGLGLDGRRAERVVKEAMQVVIDSPAPYATAHGHRRPVI